MTTGYHPLVRRLLDGELMLAELPAELREEGEEALRLVAAVSHAPVALSPGLDAKVMRAVRRHAASPVRHAWRWLAAPRDLELRIRVRPWAVCGGFAAAAAALALLVLRPPALAPTRAPSLDSVFVRFVLYAPGATRVTVAGTFNQWDPNAAPLVPAGTSGVWTATLALPVGQHQYAFVVNRRRWMQDPAAPAVDDGFGRRNSLVAVTRRGAGTL
jgi:hypothetical protein